MLYSRWISLLSISLLFAVLLLASAPFQTETPPVPTVTNMPMPTITVTPTATLTLVEHITVHGFDEQARERVVRNWGWPLLLTALFILGGLGWLVRPYVKRYIERREEKAKVQLDSVLGGDPMAGPGSTGTECLNE